MVLKFLKFTSKLINKRFVLILILAQAFILIKDTNLNKLLYLPLNIFPLLTLYFIILLLSNRYVFSLAITFVISIILHSLNIIKMTYWAFPLTAYVSLLFKDIFTLKETLYNYIDLKYILKSILLLDRKSVV